MGNLHSKRTNIPTDYDYQYHERENTFTESLVSAYGNGNGKHRNNNSIVSEQDLFASGWSKHSLSSLTSDNATTDLPPNVDQINKDLENNNYNKQLKNIQEKRLLSSLNSDTFTLNTGCCTSLKRWMILFIAAFGTYSYAYNYDTCAALQNQLIATYNLTPVQYNMLYSIFSAPNIIMPLIVGHLNDKFGVDKIIGIMSFLMFFGQSLFFTGIMVNKSNMWWMLFGRGIFGVGSETYMVTVSPLLYEYFVDKEFSTALSINISFSQLGSSSNDFLTYIFYTIGPGHNSKQHIEFAIFIGTVIILYGFIQIVLLLCYRRFCENKTKDDTRKTSFFSGQSGDTSRSTSVVSSRIAVLKDEEINGDNKNFLQIIFTGFEIRFWLLTLNLCLFYSTVLPFMSIGSSYMQDKYGFDHRKGNLLLMIVYGLGALLTCIFGWICDSIAKRLVLLLISCFLLNGSFVIFFFGDNEHVYVPIIALVLMSCSYSIFNSVLWYSFALVVNPKYIGIAYGIPTSGYSAFLAVAMAVVGALTKSGENKYIFVEYFLFLMSVLSTASVIILQLVDLSKDNILNKPVTKEGSKYSH